MMVLSESREQPTHWTYCNRSTLQFCKRQHFTNSYKKIITLSSRNCYVLLNTRMSVTLATRHRTKCISFFHDEYIKWIKHQMFSASSGVKFVYFLANSSSGKYENWWWTHSFRKRSRGQQLNSHQNLAVFVKFVVLFIWYIHLLHQSVAVPKTNGFFKLPTFRLIF